MAYAGICLTDDEQPHSDGYFSQRSQQEINAYVSSSQSPINEVQTVSLRHFGGGNETQVVTFGTGYSQVATITPLNITINPPPSSASRGGAEENGTTVTIATSAAHRLQVGDTVTVTGVAVAGYNGTFTVTAVPSTRSFQYTNAVTGLPVSGSGTATPAIAGASSSGTTATIKTAAPHNRAVGDMIVISGVDQSAATTAHSRSPPCRARRRSSTRSPPSSRTEAAAQRRTTRRSKSGSTATTRPSIGGSGLPYNNANLTAAINAISGLRGNGGRERRRGARFHARLLRRLGRPRRVRMSRS